MSGRRTLHLIPWHIGDGLDVTLNAVREVRRLRCFLTEDPETSRRQFAPLLGAEAARKSFLRVPPRADDGFLRAVLGLLETEDVGLVSDGGIPCFIDPGAWLVDALRREGVPVRAHAGASCLGTVLSLSGVEWRDRRNHVFTFAFFLEGPRLAHARFLKAVERADEPLVVFLGVHRFRACLKKMEPLAGDRRITVFFDLTKGPGPAYPYADQAITMTCSEWLARSSRVRWKSVSDVSLLVHPREAPR